MAARIALSILLFTGVVANAQPQNLLRNAGFEQAAADWSELRTQEPNAGTAVVLQAGARSGAGCLRVDHRGAGRWSCQQATRFPVTPGDIVRVGGWVRTEGLEGRMAFTPVLRDAAGKVLDWPPCKMTVSQKPGWQLIVRRLLVCRDDAATLAFEVSGAGPCAASLDDLFLVNEANLNAWRDRYQFRGLDLENEVLRLHFGGDLSMTVVDKRTGRSWEQQPCVVPWVVSESRRQKGSATLRLRNVLNASTLVLDLALRNAELDVSLASSYPDIPLEGECAFPFTFRSKTGDYVHVSEGQERTVPAAALAKKWEIGPSGGADCPWCGVSDGKSGYMILTATAEHSTLRVQAGPKGSELLSPQLVWLPQDGVWAYPRQATYVFVPDGGPEAMEQRSHQRPASRGS